MPWMCLTSTGSVVILCCKQMWPKPHKGLLTEIALLFLKSDVILMQPGKACVQIGVMHIALDMDEDIILDDDDLLYNT